MKSKSLSINNIYGKRHLPKGDNGRCQMVEGEEAALELFVANQELAKPVEPAVGDFNHPAPGPLVRMALELSGLIMPPLYMGNVAMGQDRLQGGSPPIGGVGTQVLGAAKRWIRPLYLDGVEYRLKLRHVVPVRPGHDERQRDATPVDQQMALAPVFFPDRSG